MKNNESFDNDPLIMKANQNSNFRALKTLMNTQNTIRMAHNRIKVLEANQDKNNQKIHLQLEAITKIQKTRERQSIHNRIIEQGRKELEKQKSEINLKNKVMKNQHNIKIDEVKKELEGERKQHYLQIEQKSQIAQRTISENKEKQHKIKQQKKMKVHQREEASKINLIKFHQMRQSHIKENKSIERDTLKQKQAKKQKELSRLGNIQMQLIQKQSQSQAAYLQVKNKLDSLLKNVKQQHHRSKQSLKTSVHIQSRMIS